MQPRALHSCFRILPVHQAHSSSGMSGASLPTQFTRCTAAVLAGGHWHAASVAHRTTGTRFFSQVAPRWRRSSALRNV